MELLTTITTNIAHAGIELLEIAAMGILLYGSGKTVWMLIRHKPHITLSLTRFMNIALIIMLCAEIIRLALDRKENFYVQPHQGFNSDKAALCKAVETIRHLEDYYRRGCDGFDSQLPYYT